MTNPDIPDDVASEEFRMYDDRGAETTDKSKMVSAEVTQTMKDGTVRHHLLRKGATAVS